MSNNFDQEILNDFICESEENLANSVSKIMSLSKSKHDSRVDLINELFRIFHNLKGTSSFFDFTDITNLSHKIEDIFSALRDNKIIISQDLIISILSGVDILKNYIDAIKEKEELPKIDQELLSNLSVKKFINIKNNNIIENKLQKNINCKDKNLTSNYETIYNFLKIDINVLDEIYHYVNEIIRINKELASQNNKFEFLTEPLDKLNYFANKTQNLLINAKLHKAKDIYIFLEKVIQEDVEKLGKKVTLELIDNNIEIDKNVMQNLFAILTHIIKNSIDHGIEFPEERINKNKDPIGKITINFEQIENYIHINIVDDGRGINTEKLIKKIDVSAHNLCEKTLQKMSHEEKLNLIFLPGITTKNDVTNISGRGVGMDFVKNKIEKMHGNIKINSQYNFFTNIHISLPITISKFDIFLVKSHQHKVCIYLSFIRKLLSVTSNKLQFIKNNCCIEQFGILIPVHNLYNIIHCNNHHDTVIKNSFYNLIILQFKKSIMAIAVDDFYHKEKVLMMPVPNWVKKLPITSGIAILNDSNFGLVINLRFLFENFNSATIE